MDSQWLTWTKKLQAIAQTGLAYGRDPYDQERYEELSSLAAEIAASYTDSDQEYLWGLFSSETGYATPKVDVRGVIFQDNKILLVQESTDNLWSLPGGWAEVGESASKSVEREIQEEAGIQTQAMKLLAVYDRNKHPHPPRPFHPYELFFLGDIVGGTLKAGPDIIKVEFFGEDKIPQLSSSRVTTTQVARCFERRRNPGWPTDFD